MLTLHMEVQFEQYLTWNVIVTDFHVDLTESIGVYLLFKARTEDGEIRKAYF